MDHAIVHVTVLDTNDNAPKFVFNNDDYDGYFVALPTDASSFVFVTTVKVTFVIIGRSNFFSQNLPYYSKCAKFYLNF